MEIPDYIRRKASRQFGEAGQAWVRDLPAILSRCEETWRLHGCRPVDELSISLVCFAECERFGKVIDPQGVIGAPFLECGRFLENHLLAVCWSYEMNEEPAKLRLRTRQCALLFDAVGRVCETSPPAPVPPIRR